MKKENKTNQIKNLGRTNVDNDVNKPPSSNPWTPKFYCPVSPLVPWHKGLVYKDCPVNPEQRDMAHCSECHLKGDSSIKFTKKKKTK